MSQNELARVDGPPLARLEQMVWTAEIPRRGAQRCPDRCAILFADRGERISYAELDRRSDAFAAALTERGVQAGDRIAYLGRNNDLYFPVLFGAMRAGVVLVPLNWRLAPPEIAYQLQDSQSRLLICDAELQSLAQPALATLATPPGLIETDGVEGSLRSLLLRPAPQAPIPNAPEQTVLMLYTSGTTGHPKGVMISHYAVSAARHSDQQLRGLEFLEEGCTILSAMPNFHIGGMSWMLMGLARLETVVLTADPTPANLLRLFREHGAEHSFVVPTVIRAMLDELKVRGEKPPKLRSLHYGAMPIGESLLNETMETFGCAFVQYFGMTENTGSGTCLAPHDHDLSRPHLLKSVGLPYPGMSVEIRGPDRRVLRRGEHGEIWIKSPTALTGYWNLPEKTREALVDGWYASGDGGYLDAEGYLYLTDRIKDMIVSGGENIYPVEVEEAMRQHPAVMDVAIVGVPDERWGERVAAVVELRPGKSATEEELRGFARERIAGYKCPRQFHFVPSLPRTASGKVKRGELRAQLRG
jgi:acyl-CoA synthetase (AMP-forming)/AMP-acid ligase II